MYCSVHNHTQYSNLKLRDSINRIPDLVDKAIEYGFNGIAITDHECISGHIEAIEYGEKIRKEHPNFKVILGNEIYLIKESEYKNAEKYFHFILLAKDAIGHKQIRELSSLAWERSYVERGQRRCPTFYEDFQRVIGENTGHLIASTACIGGALGVKILQKDAAYINWFLEWGLATFGQGNFFLEIQDSATEEQKIVNEYIIKFSRQTNIPYIITQDAHYLVKDDFAIFESFLNSKEEKEREVGAFYSYTYVKNESEIFDVLDYLPHEDVQEGIDNTQLIYNLIEDYDIRRDTIVPECHTGNFQIQHLLKAWYPVCSSIKYYATESPYIQDQYLIYLIEQGIIEKNFEITAVEAFRINTELEVLRHISDKLGQRLSAYLNLVKTIVDIMWEVSIIGVSRGSALCFLTNYLIGITQANPLDYDIPYWRFLNKDRAELPDVDLDSDPNKTDEIIEKLLEYFGQKRVLNCLTYKKESLKSAILTSARGLGINNDDAQALSAMVPVVRGQSYTLSDCIDGNDEKGYDPAPELISSLQEYNGLFETVQRIEGLISGSGCHASALYVFNTDYTDQVGMMRTSSGIPVTCFDYHASDKCGCLKVDELRTDCIAKMMKCMDLMLRYNVIQWQGSLRATYNKYLHPDVINYDDPEMWAAMADGKIMNLFQFETQVGGVCIRRTRPTNVKELGAANAVMRLMPQEGQENPLDRYVRFRHNIQEWYDEMADIGLTQDEVKILEKYVKAKYGNAPEQEDMMQIVMDPNISNFSLKDSNKLRKGVAKKKHDIISELKNQFFGAVERTKNSDHPVRKIFLEYVWDKMISPQIGYSFSIPHDIAYSIEAVQEANLATKYNPLFWQCACLSVNSGSAQTSMEEDYSDNGDEEDNVPIWEENTDSTKKIAPPDYGKIGKAVGDIQKSGIVVALPDCNRAELDFVPDITTGEIVYSLKAITGVNMDLGNAIIQNRPYTSLEDFLEKVQPTNVQMLSLIKAGSFDSLYPQWTRPAIVNKYLDIYAKTKVAWKDKLSMVDVKKMVELDVLPDEFLLPKRVLNFKTWVTANEYDKENRRFMISNESSVAFLKTYYLPFMTVGVDYEYNPNGYSVKKASFTHVTDDYLAPLKAFIATQEACALIYNAKIKAVGDEIIAKYLRGSISKWEMDSLHYYSHEHELANISTTRYDIRSFESLPEVPVLVEKKTNRSGREVQIFEMCSIAGTVLNADNNKHIVTILTHCGEVVDIKFYKGTYVWYNKKISVIKSNGHKSTIEDSWFSRGNLLLIHGFRRDLSFIPRSDYTHGFPHSVMLITGVNGNGTIEIKEDREQGSN